jgi:hypothetical protein
MGQITKRRSQKKPENDTESECPIQRQESRLGQPGELGRKTIRNADARRLGSDI